jgi:hypothetical protein
MGVVHNYKGTSGPRLISRREFERGETRGNGPSSSLFWSLGGSLDKNERLIPWPWVSTGRELLCCHLVRDDLRGLKEARWSSLRKEKVHHACAAF